MSETGMDTYKYEMTVIRDGVPIRSVTVEKQAKPVDTEVNDSDEAQTQVPIAMQVPTVQTPAPQSSNGFSSFDKMMKSFSDVDLNEVKGMMSSLFAFKNDEEKNAMESLVETVIQGFKGGDMTNDDGKIDFGKLGDVADKIEKEQKDNLNIIKKPVLDKFKIA